MSSCERSALLKEEKETLLGRKRELKEKRGELSEAELRLKEAERNFAQAREAYYAAISDVDATRNEVRHLERECSQSENNIEMMVSFGDFIDILDTTKKGIATFA